MIDIVLDLGLVIIVSIIMAWTLEHIGITRVFGYIIAGIVAGSALAAVIRPTLLGGFDALSAAALGFVTFSIGREFTLSEMRHMGVRGPLMAIGQALLTYVVMFMGILVLTGLHVIRMDYVVPSSLLLAATATATAPAATFEVIRRLKTHGPLTKALSMIVIVDDAVGIVVFDVSVVIARAMMTEEVMAGWGIAGTTARELGLSVLLGLAAGLAYSLCARFLRTHNRVRVLGIGMVLLVVGLSRTWELSPLLASMTLGATFANMAPQAEPAFEEIDAWSDPLLLLFFFLAGATTDFGLLRSQWPIVVSYIVLRVLGKFVGSLISAHAAQVPRSIRNLVGVALLPQAGLAVGHALLVTSLFPHLQYITMTVIVAVIVFDVVGPVLTSWTLRHCGETCEQPVSAQDDR